MKDFILGFVTCFIIVIIELHVNDTKEITRTIKLEPIRYELTVKDNKIDTVFIYSLK